MPTTDYFVADGTKVPGTTTILNLLAKPALTPWAYKRGKQGLPLYDSRDQAAEAGTIAHDLIEQQIKRGGDDTLPPQHAGAGAATIALARKGAEGFKRWAKFVKLEYLWTERHLVSEKFRFGGTPDALASMTDVGLLIVDWKTSNGLYDSHLYQLAAYGILVEETEPERGPIDEYHLMRFDKRDGSFHHHSWAASSETMQNARGAFVHTRRAYDFVKAVQRVVR